MGKKRLQELNPFIESYFKAAKEKGDGKDEQIARQFASLDPSIQRDVKQAIERIYRLAFPDRGASEYRERVNNQLRLPFSVIESRGNKGVIQAYGQALLTVRERYAGF